MKFDSSKATPHPIVFEDNMFIALNKPAGVLSHPNLGKISAPSAFLGRYNLKERRFDAPGGPIWLIHRLDLETSGVLLAAKNVQAAEVCRNLFEKNQIEKTYLALVSGVPHSKAGIWKDHIEKQIHSHMVRSVIKRGELPNAELKYTIQKTFHFHLSSSGVGTGIRLRRTIAPTSTNNTREMALLKIQLITGRTHQIRVQTASRKLPVLGDSIYGNFSLNKAFRSQTGLKRLFLHAQSLKFNITGKEGTYNIEAPLPSELEEILKTRN